MRKTKSFNDKTWLDSPNYELEFLRLENQKMKLELEQFKKNKKIDITMEKDIAALLKVSMQMKQLLGIIRQEVMIPIDLGRQIDNVIKEIENYE